MNRLIITGSNGTGKSHFAQRIADVRPDLPLFSYDALRLTENWIKKPQQEIQAALKAVIVNKKWILEGGPSLLDSALPRCEGVIWLDPPELVRAWRLLLRPWKNRGRSREELPPGNIDWLMQQYRFAIQSLRKRGEFRDEIESSLRMYPSLIVWRCRLAKDLRMAESDISCSSL